MPAKRSSRQQATAKKEKPAAAAEDTKRSRSRRGASPPPPKAGAKRKASPSPAPAKTPSKKGRTESESPAPTKRQSARGASAASKKAETKTTAKSSARAASKGDQSKGHVTRNVVEKAETKKAAASPRGRSSSQKVTAQKKETPKRNATPKKAAVSPKKKQTPKQKSPARGRSVTPKSKQKAPNTPKQKVTPKQKSTPKQKGTAKRSATPKQKPATPKTKPSPKTKTPAKSPAKQSPTKSRRSKTPVKKDDENADDASPKSDEKIKESRVEISKETKAMADEAADAVAVTEQEETKEENATENDSAEEEKADDEDVSQAQDEAEESPEAVQDEAMQDEASAAEDENVEEDQEAPEESEEKEEEPVVEAEKVEDNDQSNQVEKEEDAIEQQAESEQIESDSKEECESAESDQVEADVIVPEKADSTNEAAENMEAVELNENTEDVELNENSEAVELNENTEAVEKIENNEAIEVNSDVSSKDDDKVIEINEDSGEAMIIEEDTREEAATGNAGAGDSQWTDQSDKPETEIEAEDNSEDIQEVGVTPAPVIEVQDEEESVNDVSSTGIEEAEDAIQILEPESIGNSQVSNGATDVSPPRKRKLEDMDNDNEEIVAKKVKTVEESKIENGSLSHESDVTSDYVVVNINEIPAADSEEIKNSLPTVPVQQSSSVDQNPVFSRVFIPNPGYTPSGDASKQFSVVSYNVLADCHLFRNDYSFTEAKYLAPEYRLTNLMKELEYLNGDVVCLQEVEPEFFNNTLLPKMKSLGYEGIHKKRTTEYFDEGEATFFKLNRFTLVDYSTPRLADLVEKELVDGIEPSVRDAVRKYMDLSDVLIVTKLKCVKTGAEVTIGNIHVVWGGMKIPDAQCVQIASAIKEVVSKAGVDNLPHLICGDFNSPPNSPGYLVARDGYPTGDETVTKLQEINSLTTPSGQMTSLVNSLWPAFQHTSSLRSAYNEVEGSEPKISSYNKVMKDTVDYVFYSSSCLDNVGVLRTADKGAVTGTGGIPDQHFPSDHVSLKAVLSFK